MSSPRPILTPSSTSLQQHQQRRSSRLSGRRPATEPEPPPPHASRDDKERRDRRSASMPKQPRASTTSTAAPQPKTSRTRRTTKAAKKKKKRRSEGAWFAVNTILDDRIFEGELQYFVDWEPDQKTGEEYPPSWIPAVLANEPLRNYYEEKKKKAASLAAAAELAAEGAAKRAAPIDDDDDAEDAEEPPAKRQKTSPLANKPSVEPLSPRGEDITILLAPHSQFDPEEYLKFSQSSSYGPPSSSQHGAAAEAEAEAEASQKSAIPDSQPTCGSAISQRSGPSQNEASQSQLLPEASQVPPTQEDAEPEHTQPQETQPEDTQPEGTQPEGTQPGPQFDTGCEVAEASALSVVESSAAEPVQSTTERPAEQAIEQSAKEADKQPEEQPEDRPEEQAEGQPEEQAEEQVAEQPDEQAEEEAEEEAREQAAEQPTEAEQSEEQPAREPLPVSEQSTGEPLAVSEQVNGSTGTDIPSRQPDIHSEIGIHSGDEGLAIGSGSDRSVTPHFLTQEPFDPHSPLNRSWSTSQSSQISQPEPEEDEEGDNSSSTQQPQQAAEAAERASLDPPVAFDGSAVQNSSELLHSAQVDRGHSGLVDDNTDDDDDDDDDGDDDDEYPDDIFVDWPGSISESFVPSVQFASPPSIRRVSSHSDSHSKPQAPASSSSDLRIPETSSPLRGTPIAVENMNNSMEGSLTNIGGSAASPSPARMAPASPQPGPPSRAPEPSTTTPTPSLSLKEALFKRQAQIYAGSKLGPNDEFARRAASFVPGFVYDPSASSASQSSASPSQGPAHNKGKDDDNAIPPVVQRANGPSLNLSPTEAPEPELSPPLPSVTESIPHMHSQALSSGPLALVDLAPASEPMTIAPSALGLPTATSQAETSEPDLLQAPILIDDSSSEVEMELDHDHASDRAASAEVAPSSLRSNEHIITLPLNTHMRPLYARAIQERAVAIEAFSKCFTDKFSEPDKQLVVEIDNLFSRLLDICDLPVHTSRLPPMSREQKAKHGLTSSGKMNFIHELITHLMDTEKHVLVLVRTGPALEYLDAIFETSYIRHRLLVPQSSASSDSNNNSGNETQSVTVTLASTEVGAAMLPADADIVISYDESSRSGEDVLLAPFIERSALDGGPVIFILVATYTLEHIDTDPRMPRTIPALERRNALLNAVCSIRHLVSDEASAKDIGDLGNSDFVAANFAALIQDPAYEWSWMPQEIPDSAFDFYLSSQSNNGDEDGTVDASSDRAGPSAASVPLRRKRDDLDDGDADNNGNAKRTKVVSSSLEESRRVVALDDDLKAFLNLLPPAADGPEVPIPVEHLELLRQKSMDLEKKLSDRVAMVAQLSRRVTEYQTTNEELNSTLRKFQPKFVEALADRGAFERKHDEMAGKLEKANQALTNTKTAVADQKQEIANLRQSLSEAHSLLKESPDKDLSRLGALEQQVRDDSAKIDHLKKRIQSADKDLDFMRSSYQDASRRAAELGTENQELAAKIEDQSRQLAANHARVHEAQARGTIKELQRRLDEEGARRRNAEHVVERMQRELALLKNGRRETRGASVPRSPRLPGASATNGGTPNRPASATNNSGSNNAASSSYTHTLPSSSGASSRGASPSFGGGGSGAAFAVQAAGYDFTAQGGGGGSGSGEGGGPSFLNPPPGSARWGHLRE